MYYIGIDTGWSGAIAMYDGKQFQVCDCPNIKTDNPVDRIDLILGLVSSLPINCYTKAIIEKPFAMARKRGQGYDSGGSMLSYGTNYGAWIAALREYKMSVELIHPRTWQAALGLKSLPGNNIKEQSRYSALQLAPYLEKQLIKSKSGRYDAINIAYYLSTLHRG